MRIMHLVAAFRVTVANTTGSREKIRFIWEIDWLLAYTSLTVATTLICTLLIMYRIIRLAQRIFLFRNIIAAVIESSLIYTLTHILLLVAVARHALEATNVAVMIATYGRVNRSISELFFCSVADCFLFTMTGYRTNSPRATCRIEV